MSEKVLIAGSVAYDRIMDFPGYFKDQIMPDKIHSLNVSFLVNDLKESFGGTAGNIAYSLSMMREPVSILGAVGDKDFSSYSSWLEKNNIDFSNLRILKDKQTASAYIITDKADNQITGFFPGAMLEPLGLKDLPAGKLGIISAQHPSDMINLPGVFKKKKIPYIFDPGQQVTSLSGGNLRKAIAGSEVLIGNDYEMALITKKTMWGIKQLLDQTKILITTFGEKGSRIQQGLSSFDIPPAKPKSVVDPTGAGDAYRAGIIKGLAEKWNLEKMGRLGSVVAAYAVENYGTQVHQFDWSELSARYRQNFQEKL